MQRTACGANARRANCGWRGCEEVRTHRRASRLRETAAEIGISAATLLRVESGRIPDVVPHSQTDHTAKPETTQALARMLLLAANPPIQEPEAVRAKAWRAGSWRLKGSAGQESSRETCW